MTTNHKTTGVEQTPQTVNSVQYNCGGIFDQCHICLENRCNFYLAWREFLY